MVNEIKVKRAEYGSDNGDDDSESNREMMSDEDEDEEKEEEEEEEEEDGDDDDDVSVQWEREMNESYYYPRITMYPYTNFNVYIK